MSFTLRMDELSRIRVSADLGSSDGRISLALKPAEEINPVPTFLAGVLIHFETVVENGCGKLHVFTSTEDATPRSPAAFADFPNPAGHFDYPPENHYAAIEKDAYLPHFSEDYTPNFGPSGFGSSGSFLGPADILEPNHSASAFSADFGFFTHDMRSDEDLSQEALQNVASAAGGFDVPFFPSPVTSTSYEDYSSASSSPSASTISFVEADIPESVSKSAPQSPDTGAQVGSQRPRRLSCLHPGCKRRFMSEYTRKLHMGTHEPKPRHPCEMGCSETFSRQHDRLRHEVAKHGRKCEWSCNHCRRFFSCQETRDKHKCSSNSPVYQ